MLKIFDFECHDCGKIEEHLIENDDDCAVCSGCGSLSQKIVTLGHGGIHTDTSATWLESASKVLVKPGEPPVTTRKDYNKYIKDNNIIPSGGDAKTDGKFSMV